MFKFRTIKYYLSGFIAVLFWLSPNIALGQAPELFKGRINDLNDIDLSLNMNGDKIEGEMKLLRSATVLDLKGKKRGNKWELQESKDGVVSGFIEGEFRNGFFDGDWTNLDQTLSAKIQFERAQSETKFASRCGNNKWARIFEGSVGDEKAVLILQKDCLNDLNGVIRLKEESLEVDGVFTKGNSDIKELSVASTLRTINGLKAGFLNGKLTGNRKFTGWLIKAGKRERVAFEYKDEIAVGCKVFMDYMTSFDLLYPKSRETELNKIILAKASEWQTVAYRYMDSLRRVNFDLKPSLRHQARAYGGYRLVKADQKVISGYMQMSNSWGGKESVWAFNYEVENNQLFEWSNQFKRRFNYAAFFKSKIETAAQKMPLSGDEDFDEWMAKQAFDQFVLGDTGIVFISEFHPVFGMQKILIPYEDLKGKVKKKRLLKGLLK